MFITILYSILLYTTVLYSKILYSTLLYSSVFCTTVLHSNMLYSTILYITILFSSVLHTTVFYSNILYSNIGKVIAHICRCLFAIALQCKPTPLVPLSIYLPWQTAFFTPFSQTLLNWIFPINLIKYLTRGVACIAKQ